MLLLFLWLPLMSPAQSTVRVASYNVLNFPTGTMPDRQDTLAIILEDIQPDLLLLQELKSAEGLTMIAEESCAGLPGNWMASDYVPLQSNPNSGWPLQQALVYNNEVLGMLEEDVILTSYRDVNAYRMFVRDQVTLDGDTTFLNVFVTHLKSSQGADNEAMRLAMVQDFMAALEAYDPEVPAIFAGDFNLYSSNEPAYQAILSPDNPVVFLDPIDAPGEWSEASFGQPQLLTQSTRSSQIYGDGAGGGLDDRFDFAMLSTPLFEATSALQYVEGSYVAYGNSGLCYNQSFVQCQDGGATVSDAVNWALYHMSDHLPIVFDLSTSTPLSVDEPQAESGGVGVLLLGDALHIQGPQQWRGEVTVYSADGRLLHATRPAQNGLRIPASIGTGVVLVHLRDTAGQVHVSRHVFP